MTLLVIYNPLVALSLLLGCSSYIAGFANKTNKKTEVLELASQWEKKKARIA